MKIKHLILFLCISKQLAAQTFLAVPSYSAVTNTFNAATGNIKFYFNGTSQTLTVGRGANGVCIFGNDMFVAFDDAGSQKGILWYANVSFSSGVFSAATPVVLTNGQGTFSVSADASGNIYTANSNGTVSKFIRNATAPFYTSANSATATFWSGGAFAEASGVFVDDATSTLWVVSNANNQVAVCKLNAFGNASNIKKINTNGAYIQKPNGVSKDNLGNVWIGNSNNNYILRINNAIVSQIITELNAANFTLKTLIEGSQINDFAVSAAGHQLGGIVYDSQYSSKMYINDQKSGENTFVYSFTPSNSTPTFAATTMSQIYPGAGQSALIPCTLLPNSMANGTTINAGQTANLTASNCATGSTYQWKDGGTVVGTSSSTLTTPVLYTSKTYTVACNNGGSCIGTAATVTVTVNGACTTPANPTLAVGNNLSIYEGQSTSLTAEACSAGSSYIWKKDANTVATTATFSTPPLFVTTTYTVFCKNGECLSLGLPVTINVAACLQNLALESPISDYNSGKNISQANTATGKITATNKITGSANVTYQAKSIELNTGFKADNGTIFKAEIGGCESTNMQVSGRFLYDSKNQKIILNGVNLPVLDDWDFPTSDKLSELEKTGANSVRIQWYMNYGQPARPAFTLNDLDNLITRCKNYQMIPILELHDLTCNSNVSLLNSQIVPWLTSAPVLALLNKHKKYLIVNFANELGVYRWVGSTSAALATFKNEYKTAITSLRNAGVNVPLMIDAPDCGSSINVFNAIGAELVSHDPKHNLLLSVHAYWAGYNGTSEIATAIANNLPLVFGEVANKQEDNGDQCYYDLDGTTENHPAPTGYLYQNLLNTCQANEIGRLYWAWNKDGCSSRQMSSTGNFINLTPYGTNVVNNATYGILTTAVRSTNFN